MSQPNILLIMADQLAAPALPAYGHQVVKAPAISALADEGVVFENAYCNSPLCAPSRGSMLTGLQPHRAGTYDNAAELPASRPTFAHYLRLDGYRTALSGKMHFTGADQLHGYEERLTTDIYPSSFDWTPNWAEPDPNLPTQDLRNVLEAGPCARSTQIDYDEEVAHRAVQWLYDRARDEERRPFFLTVSFTSPHDPYVALDEFWDLYRDEEIDLPAVGSIPFEEMDAHSRHIHDHFSIGEASVSEADLRRLRHGYYASVSYVDSKVRELSRTLESAGLAENTIVILTSDHGDMLGERGLFYKKTFFEWSARVPLIFRAPGRFEPHRVVSPVSLVDLLVTLHELGGGNVDAVLETDGTSLVPHLLGAPAAERPVAAEYLAGGVDAPVFMLRTGRYKLLYSEHDPPVLYDLETDPDELSDLASSPVHAEALAELLALAEQLWNPAQIRSEVIADQARRRLVERAHRIGRPPAWDYQPFTDASQQWVRRGRWTAEVEAEGQLAPRLVDQLDSRGRTWPANRPT